MISSKHYSVLEIDYYMLGILISIVTFAFFISTACSPVHKSDKEKEYTNMQKRFKAYMNTIEEQHPK